MEISILLAEQILAMFLTMAVGFGVVRAGLFKTEDSRIISNMLCISVIRVSLFIRFRLN